jgi:hypothetical protein
MVLTLPPFFRLADLIDENGQAVFPGIRLVVYLTYLALELKKFPSEVYQQYLTHPRDIELLLLAIDHKAKMEQKEIEKTERARERIARH